MLATPAVGTGVVTGVDPITIRQSLIPSSLRPLSSQDEVEWREDRKLECIDSAIGQETQLAVLGTTERALYTVQGIRNVLHYDALWKEPESYGSVKKLREAGGIHRPELNGKTRKQMEQTRNYCIIQGLGSVNPHSYPCRHVRASDLWCRRQSDVITLRLGTTPYHRQSRDPRHVR